MEKFQDVMLFGFGWLQQEPFIDDQQNWIGILSLNFLVCAVITCHLQFKEQGYFSKENIQYMDKCGYEFVIMMKGMKELVKSLVLEVKGIFEEDRRYSIRDYKVSGITVKKQLYPSDEKERYFHIFYDDRKKSSEHEAIEAKIDRMAECLHKHEGTKYEIRGGGFAKYFDLIYYNKGKKVSAK